MNPNSVIFQSNLESISEFGCIPAISVVKEVSNFWPCLESITWCKNYKTWICYSLWYIFQCNWSNSFSPWFCHCLYPIKTGLWKWLPFPENFCQQEYSLTILEIKIGYFTTAHHDYYITIQWMFLVYYFLMPLLGLMEDSKTTLFTQEQLSATHLKYWLLC